MRCPDCGCTPNLSDKSKVQGPIISPDPVGFSPIISIYIECICEAIYEASVPYKQKLVYDKNCKPKVKLITKSKNLTIEKPNFSKEE